MAAQPQWDDDDGDGAEAARRRSVRRADVAYRQRVEAQEDRGGRRIDLMGEFAAVAEEMVSLSRRGELSPQQVATARRLTARAERALRALETERE